jgi:hypothetical protein
MKKSRVAFVFVLFVLTAGCRDLVEPSTGDNGPGNVEATVKASTTDYNQDAFRRLFPDSVSLQRISSAFTNNYTEQRKTTLVENMLTRVSALGEVPAVLDTIVTRAGCRTPGENILPTYAERAHYAGRDAWIVQFTYGLGVPTFGHYKCFAYSISNLDTLDYLGCR